MRHFELFVPVAVHEGNVILKPDCGMHCSNTIDLPTHCTMFPSYSDWKHQCGASVASNHIHVIIIIIHVWKNVLLPLKYMKIASIPVSIDLLVF